MKTIKLAKNKGEAIVDDENFDELSKYSWHPTEGYASRTISYPMINGKRQVETILMHRQVMNHPIGKIVDHINMNPLDNRKENLRLCTFIENQRHAKPNSANTTGYKGVSYRKREKVYIAQIRNGVKKIYLGSFKDVISAAKAYNEAAKKYHGEFAYLNKV